MKEELPPKSPQSPLPFYICFFLSGVAGLIYEVLWSRYLALALGGTGQAQIIILSTYMGGLALGAWLFGNRADTTADPLKLYVGLELGIGLLGAIYPRLFEPVRSLFVGTIKMLGLSPVAWHLSAILACALSILLPTTLMGGTLPVLGKYLIRNRSDIGRRIAGLYYLNSLGAVFGSLWAGFWLIRVAGLEMSMVTAASLNFLVAGTVWILSKIGGTAGTSAEPEPDEDRSKPELQIAKGEPTATNRVILIALSAITLSGFASMIYEVCWIRLMTLVLGSSSFSFALMLSAFISGITLGSFLLSLKRSDGGYYGILGWSELAIGSSALLTILIYQRLPVVLNQWRTSLVREEYAYPIYQCGVFVLCFSVMVVPTVFMGMTLPAASRVASQGLKTLGGKIGDVFALNTIGTLFGAAVAGFFLLPSIGVKNAILVAVTMNLVLGLAILWTDPALFRSGLLRPPSALALTVAGLISYTIFSSGWDIRFLTAGTYRSRRRIESFAHFRREISRRELLYYRDGADASIAVSSDKDPRKGHVLALLINGKADASNDTDMVTQVMLGHLPMLIHPKPENVLVVGLGAGVSAGAATLYDPRRVDCVELIPEVVEAARHFHEYNHDVVDNPKVKIVVQDAKTFLQMAPDSYDVIINQPTNLWITGVAGLFTREYYEACREKLRPGGMFELWIQCYDIQDVSMFSILNTFHEVFPYSTIFNLSSADIAVIGSTEPFKPDFPRMKDLLDLPGVSAELAPFGIRDLLPILSMQMAAKNLTPGPHVTLGGMNSDFFPTLEFEASKGFFIGSNATGLKMLDRRNWAPGLGGLWIEQYHPNPQPPESSFASYFEQLNRMSSLQDNALSAWCDLWERSYHGSTRIRLARSRIPDNNELGRLALLDDERLTSSTEAMEMRTRLLVRQYEADRNYAHLPDAQPLRASLERLVGESPSSRPWGLMILGDLEADALKFDSAVQRYAEALKGLSVGVADSSAEDLRTEILIRLAEVHLDLNMPDTAQEDVSEFREEDLSAKLSLRLHLLRCRILQAEGKREFGSRGF